jgi:L-galactose dehydrogenase
MQYTKLGRTGIKTSILGLGCGGHSRLGLSKNLGDNNAISIVKTALNLGINFFDTSASYGTESVLGKGLEGTQRESFVVSSKFPPIDRGKGIKQEGSLTKSLDNSLTNMKLDYIDIFHLHGVLPQDYTNVRDRFLPELIRAKESGKIGWFGITEMFGRDTSHIMEKQALKDNIWDVIMIGFNLMNPSAVKTIFPTTIKNRVGTLIMFAVRTALSNKKRLLEIIHELEDNGEINPNLYTKDNPLDFLTDNNAAASIMDAAYRFCRYTDGVDVVLSGTSSVKHLEDNVKSILAPPLSKDVYNKIMKIFGDIDTVSAQ